MLTRILLALATTLALPAVVYAAPPTTVAVEGVMHAANAGPVADGDYAVTFALYAGEKDAKAAWAEKDIKLKVIGGRFGHALGSVTPLMPALLKSLSPGWLGLKVGADPELQRRPLHAVPWSLRAAVADALDCSGCVKNAALAAGTVGADKVAFTYAGSKTKGGPAIAALDLQCTGCVSVAELKIDKDLDLGGNALKAKAISAGQISATSVAATTFWGDGSKLTGIKTPAGSCPKGQVVSGIDGQGKLICLTPTTAKLPSDALDDVSGGLMTTEFVDTWPSKNTPVAIPDNNPTGVGDDAIVGDTGVAKSLTVHLELENSDLATVEVTLFDPTNAKYVLIEKGAAKGTKLKTVFPTQSKPKSGDLGAWAGKNPKGKWRIKVADTKFLNNGKDGNIKAWSIQVQTVSNQKVEATKDLHVKGNLTVGGALIAKGSFRYPYGDKAPFKCDASTVAYAWVNTKDQSLMICNGKDWGVVSIGVSGTQDKPAASCLDLQKKVPGTKTGTYWIKPPKGTKALQMWCDMDTEIGRAHV